MRCRRNFLTHFTNSIKAVLILSAVFLLGVSSGDQIELQTYFNARYSANFRKNSGNVRTVLVPQTKATVTEVKKMPSGNYGLRVKVLDGKAKDKSVWVYYNKKTPRMKVYSSKDATGNEVSDEDSEKIGSVKTKDSVEGLEEPELSENESQIENDSTVENLTQAESKIEKVNSSIEDCDKPGAKKTTDTSRIVINPAANASIIKPVNTINTKRGVPTCDSKNGYDACTYQGDHAPSIFKIFNTGPNRVVAGGNFDKRREWSFYSPDLASQDLGFYVEDYNGSSFDNSQRSYMMLFPRNSLSSVKVSGEDKIVTLPTGETVTFNQRTNEIVGGAFAETSRIGSSSSAPGVKYQGSGVLVRVNAAGANEPKQAANATITKRGQTCQVPASELWNQGNNSQLNFKFPTDAEFSKFLVSRCGFSI